MRWPLRRILPFTLAGAVLVAAAAAFSSVIPIHHVQRARLAKLVVATPPSGFTTKGANAAEMAAASNPFAAVKSIAKKSPNTTGAYSVAWTGSPDTSKSLSALAMMVPSVGDAKTVLSQAIAKYQQPGSFTADGYTFDQTFTIPTPSGASAATYLQHKGKTTQYVAVVVFRSGRTVVTEFCQEGSRAPAQADVISLSAAEYRHLTAMGSAESLTTTHWPVTATIVWWAVAGAVVVGLVTVPFAIERARRLTLERAERNARHAFQGRGGKIAKRQAVRKR